MVRLAFLGLVLAEVAGFVLVGQAAGLPATLLLVVLSSLLGALVLRHGGLAAVRRAQAALARGGDPRPALREGGFRVAAAALLIVPGFLSSLAGLLLLLPPVQGGVLRLVRRQGTGPEPADFASPRQAGPMRPSGGEPIPDAEWEEIAPPKRPTHRPSGWTRH